VSVSRPRRTIELERELACDTHNTIDEMQKVLFGYRDNMRVEIEPGIAVTASTVADLRALPTWPDGLVLNIHVDLDPRLSIVRVERAS